jgi:hypothetical protein
MRSEEGTYLAHRQGNPLRWLFPWEHAHFGLRREHRGLHGDGVWMRRDIIRQDHMGVWQLRTNSRVTVKTKSGLVRYILVRNFSIFGALLDHRCGQYVRPGFPCRHRLSWRGWVEWVLDENVTFRLGRKQHLSIPPISTPTFQDSKSYQAPSIQAMIWSASAVLLFSSIIM